MYKIGFYVKVLAISISVCHHSIKPTTKQLFFHLLCSALNPPNNQNQGTQSNQTMELPKVGNIGVRQSKPKTTAHGLSCVWYFDAMIRCVGLGNQFTKIYRTGDIDTCEEAKEDLITCGKIKWAAIGDIEAATAKLQASNLQDSTSIGIIWEARDEPSLHE